MSYKFIKYIWRFLQPFKKRLFVFFFLSIVISAGTLVEPVIYKITVDYLVSSELIQMSYVLKLLMFWAFLSIFTSLAFLAYRYFSDQTYLRLVKEFFEYAYSKMLAMDIKKHVSKRSGELVKKIDNGGWAMFDLLYQTTLDLFPSILVFVSVMVLIFNINWKMAFISISLVPVYILVFVVFGKKASNKQRESTKIFEKITGQAFDLVANIFAVKSFAMEKHEFSVLSEKLRSSFNLQKGISKIWAYIHTAQMSLNILNKFIIFSGGVYLISLNEISVGDLIMFLSLSQFIYSPLLIFGSMSRRYYKFKAEIESAYNALEEKIEIEDLPSCRNIYLKKGEIEFENVGFNFGSGKNLFSGLSFVVADAQVCAIVGHSGAGKSTIVSLLNRFYDVNSGAIIINGRNIKEFTLSSLRKNIGMVLQDNTMFNDSIFNNIKYGNIKASRAQVIAAAKKAQIHRFVMSLPEKYETMVGERGLKLSGGERQRVAIARAILKNPPILILDEATSALDSETEKLIQKALSEVMKGRTTIIVAHRLSTVRKADNIIVMSKGKLVEQGTHEELMKSEGRYKKMVDMQVKGFFE
ncbi:MAG: ABC transporter ATP-binding protein [Candidatus Gracilibacteria bacterium]|jgi:ABC-type multidrug transport system fused ATPase/permease subunit|nr:ABC transporter ATP-binding protein [Candidatus Gracilibacteria bacterium]